MIAIEKEIRLILRNKSFKTELSAICTYKIPTNHEVRLHKSSTKYKLAHSNSQLNFLFFWEKLSLLFFSFKFLCPSPWRTTRLIFCYLLSIIFHSKKLSNHPFSLNIQNRLSLFFLKLKSPPSNFLIIITTIRMFTRVWSRTLDFYLII